MVWQGNHQKSAVILKEETTTEVRLALTFMKQMIILAIVVDIFQQTDTIVSFVTETSVLIVRLKKHIHSTYTTWNPNLQAANRFTNDGLGYLMTALARC